MGQGRSKTSLGKVDLRGLEKGGGGGLGLGRKAPPPPARSQRAPPRPGALRAVAWAVVGGKAEPGRYHSEQRGGLGGREEPGVRKLLGAGCATPWEKGLGTSRMNQSASKAKVTSRGSFSQWEGRTLQRFGGRKEKKKKRSPMNQHSNAFGGLEG